MTSINVLKLSNKSGLLVCDEARFWNPEWMIFYTPEKIRRITDFRLQTEQKLVMFMGQTGTSSIGDEWIEEVKKEITFKYNKFKQIMLPDKNNCFMDLNEIVKVVFNKIVSIKHKHIDDFLRGKFGFGLIDLIQGYYKNEMEEKIELNENDLIEEALKYVTNDGFPSEVKGIYGNSQILAGFSPDEGFKIYYMTEKWPVCEEVTEIFLAQGSGRDMCDLELAAFATSINQKELKIGIRPEKGLLVLLQALYRTINQVAGVGGYPKIIYIDGTKENPGDWVDEIFDYRSKLALEIAAATYEGFLEVEAAEELLFQLIFKNVPFSNVNRMFFNKALDRKRMSHFLRGYR